MSEYGTFMDTFIENYKEMLTLIVQARIASDRVDEWQKSLKGVVNPEPVAFGDRVLEWLIHIQYPSVETNSYYEKYL